MDNAELANYLANQSANTADADFGARLEETADSLRTGTRYAFGVGKPDVDPSGSVTFRGQAMWAWDSRFPVGHPSYTVWEIADTFNESTNDTAVLLDGLAAVDLEHAHPEWIAAQIRNLEAEATYIKSLLDNAVVVLRGIEHRGIQR
jgi:hypothetical protein